MRLAILTISALCLVSADLPARAAEDSASSTVKREETRRARTECAMEWQKMKRAGKTGSLLWREFYPACMKRLTGTDIIQK
jgi:hypothetical protein